MNSQKICLDVIWIDKVCVPVCESRISHLRGFVVPLLRRDTFYTWQAAPDLSISNILALFEALDFVPACPLVLPVPGHVRSKKRNAGHGDELPDPRRF
jgi:hypothetical protein